MKKRLIQIYITPKIDSHSVHFIVPHFCGRWEFVLKKVTVEGGFESRHTVSMFVGALVVSERKEK